MAERLLLIEILGKSSSAVRAFRETETASTGLGSKFAGLGKAAGLLAGGAGLALVAEGLHKCIDAAEEEQTSTTKLSAAFKAVGLDTDKYGKSLEDTRDKSRNLGFTNVEVNDSLAKLIIPTKNVGEATRQLAIAQDFARLRNISLATATDTLVKAQTGSQRALKALGLAIQPVTAATDAYKEKQKELKQPIDDVALAQAKLTDMNATAAEVTSKVAAAAKGQGQAYADTAAGGMATFSAQLDNIEAKIGEKLLPVFDKLLQWVNTHWPEISSAVDTALKIAGKAIELIMPTIKLLGSSIVTMVKLVHAILTGDWSAAWSAAKGQFSAAWDYMRSSLTNLENLIKGPVTAAWNGIKGTVTGVWSTVKSQTDAIFFPVYNRIKSAFEWIRDNAQKCWEAISSAVKSVWGGIKTVLGAMAAAIDAVASALGKLLDLYRAVSGAIGGLISPPTTKTTDPGPLPPGGGRVPAAVGALSVTPGMSYLVGESGPEIFTPSTGGAISPNAGGVNLHVHFSGTVLADDRRAICDTLAREMYSALRRQRLSGLPAIT